MSNFEKIIDKDLNFEQKEAVEYFGSPQLIFAGAGSGKTRVLTCKIANIIVNNICRADQILAVTFTNKAANEMRQRVEKLIGEKAKLINLGTFHSICAKILRQEAKNLGFLHNFTIYDANDQLNVIKSLMKMKNISQDYIHPRQFRNFIENVKQKMQKLEDLEKDYKFGELKTKVELYEEYQTTLKKSNAMDFNDLLLYPTILFQTSKILKKYQNKFRFVLVDEYQDTNSVQFKFIENLSREHQQLVVVGDDDQSIYGWRGADVTNILQFEQSFPDAKIFKLEQNYRSTKNILSVANSVIQNNENRAEKLLWTKNNSGTSVKIIACSDDRAEGEEIVRLIQQTIFSDKFKFSDFAILYRTNAQSRQLEEGLRREGLPYTIVGGVRFYERKEIKDITAYLKVITNSNDSASLRRVINYPRRGIGRVSQEKIEKFANENKISLFKTIQQVEKLNLTDRVKNRIIDFRRFLEKYILISDKLSCDEFTQIFLEETGMLWQLRLEDKDESKGQLENIESFLANVSEYSESSKEPSLGGFLEEISLYTDIDQLNDSSNQITLMTLHSAKGMEFPVVFITGVEDGLLPHSQNLESKESLDEERRLFYVGITRAEKTIFITFAENRFQYDGFSKCIESRFLDELPLGSIERIRRIPKYIQTKRRKNRRDNRGLQSIPKKKETYLHWKIGHLVRHKTFGEGKITSIKGSGENVKISICFSGNLNKKFMAKYVQLTLL